MAFYGICRIRCGIDAVFQRVLSTRNTVARGIDLVQVRIHFEIGRHVVEYEQQGQARAAYGKELLALLAERLTAEFGKGLGEATSLMPAAFIPLIRHAGQLSRQRLDNWRQALCSRKTQRFKFSRQRLENPNAPSA